MRGNDRLFFSGKEVTIVLFKTKVLSHLFKNLGSRGIRSINYR